MRQRIIITFVLLFTSFFFVKFPVAVADDTASGSGQTVSDLKDRINQLQSKISDLQGQEKSLSSEIIAMDNKISLSELRVNETKQEINDVVLDIDTAQKKIINLEGSLSNLTKVLLRRIKATYEARSTTQPIAILASSNTLNDYATQENYIKAAQEHDKRIAYETVQARNDYANQKIIFEGKKKKLESLQKDLQDYSKQLEAQQDQKKKLLADTQGSETNYQRLLSQARAQLAGFSRFAASQGGASLLSNQTVCDAWGCYYNQRDTQWGGMSLNGTEYTIASDGCLVTSMAMVMTHYGKKVTPVDINADPDNFASYEHAYLLYKVSAGGATAERISASIDSTLSSGNPVIVGVKAYGGTHFIVLVSGSNGNYAMNDPFLAGGHNISFSDHYSLGSIFEVDKVNVN